MGVEQQPKVDGTATPHAKKAVKSAKHEGSERDVGVALRSVYQKTVEEAVPDEFLDLLGKLG